jgi:hypothetical protein
MSNSGVILQSDGSNNLIIKDPSNNLANLIIGSLHIDNITGYLRAIDGSIYADASIHTLITGTGLLIGDNATNPFVINHNLNTDNHIISIYDVSSLIFPDIEIGVNTDIINFYVPIPLGTTYRAVIMGF